MLRTRIKICGITRPEDAALAASLGADAIGLNLFAGPRRITISHARSINAIVPPMVDTVALIGPGFAPHKRIDPQKEYLCLLQIECDAVQVHDLLGQVSDRNSLTRDFSDQKFWASIPVTGRSFPTEMHALLAQVRELSLAHVPSALVLDTAVPGQLGGTGKTFNWHWIAEARAAGELDGLPPIILAGGLTPDNVADAIRIARPYAVDVSSGVEVPGQPGIKDPARLRAFIQAVRAADAESPPILPPPDNHLP